MPLYQAVILAIVQGVTEFLPISSTAHLALFPWLFGWPDPGLTFDIALHLGTLVAVAIYFLRTWLRLLGLALGKGSRPADPHDPDADLYDNPRLLWFLVAATIPGGLAGLAFEKQAETSLRSPYVIAVMMIGVGLFLWWAERTGRQEKDLGHVSLGDSLAVGLSQAVAIIPGTSRSGITIATALVRGVGRAAAARFSFLLATPILAGAAAKAALNLLRDGLAPEMRVAFLAGIVISGLTGYLVIAFFLRYLQTNTLRIFIWYRIICGIIILVLAIFFRDPVRVL
jgi:undecaprenyl-diphosphatase